MKGLRYTKPETAVHEIAAGSILMSSGGSGRALSSNIGLKIGDVHIDPSQAW